MGAGMRKSPSKVVEPEITVLGSSLKPAQKANSQPTTKSTPHPSSKPAKKDTSQQALNPASKEGSKKPPGPAPKSVSKTAPKVTPKPAPAAKESASKESQQNQHNYEEKEKSKTTANGSHLVPALEEFLFSPENLCELDDFLKFHINREITEMRQNHGKPLIYLAPFNERNIESFEWRLRLDEDHQGINHVRFAVSRIRWYLREDTKPDEIKDLLSTVETRANSVFFEAVNRRYYLNEDALEAQKRGRPLMGRPPRRIIENSCILPMLSSETIASINASLKGCGLKIVKLKRGSEDIIGQMPIYFCDDIIREEVLGLIMQSVDKIMEMRKCSSHFILFGAYFPGLIAYRFYDIVLAFEKHERKPFYNNLIFETGDLEKTVKRCYEECDENSFEYRVMRENQKKFRRKAIFFIHYIRCQHWKDVYQLNQALTDCEDS